jgi:hypothetical protein
MDANAPERKGRTITRKEGMKRGERAVKKKET